MYKSLNASIYPKLFKHLDYWTTFELAYTSKFFNKLIKTELSLLSTLNLNNYKYPNEEETIYKILQKHSPFLKSIILEIKNITNEHTKLLTSNIINLNWNYCQYLTDESLYTIALSCKNIESWELHWIPNFTNAGWIEIIKNCPKWKKLNITANKHFNNDSLMLIPDYLHNWTHLNLTRCFSVTDEFLVKWVKKNWELIDLNLYALDYWHCSFIQCMVCERLEVLDWCGNQNVNDDWFVKGRNQFKNIKMWNLTWCIHIGDRTIEALFSKDFNKQCKLELLSLHGWTLVTDKTLNILSENAGVVNNWTTFDIVACININEEKRKKESLWTILPNITCFQYFD